MISIILGTRPEIIKMSPVIRECEKRGIKYNIIHSGQHYSENMDKVFFDQLDIPRPDYNLNVGSGEQGEQTAKILSGIERIFQENKPDIVLVQGDTNTVLAGALAAAKMNISVGHIEAGLRSYFREMPEEINRVLTDHCSDFLFAPTEKSKNILLNEGIDKGKIFLTGNTVVDSVIQNLEFSKSGTDLFKSLRMSFDNYFLATIHRKENVDSKDVFRGILKALSEISEEYNTSVVYPIHPRSRKMISQFGLKSEGIIFTEPLDYLTFLQAEKNARLILTDSGGVQEEACILGVPCVTIRNNTERPETIDVGANILGGTDKNRIKEATDIMMKSKKKWQNPFGDGNAAKYILDIISSKD